MSYIIGGFQVTFIAETLKGFSYKSDLESTDNVRHAVQKLPNSLKVRWGEKKMEISQKVPSLHDFDLCYVHKFALKPQLPRNRSLSSISRPFVQKEMDGNSVYRLKR